MAVIASSRDLVVDQELPTLAELGVDFIDVPSPIGVFLPADVPDEVANKLSTAIAKAVNRDSFVESMRNLYIPVTYKHPVEGDAYIRELRENVKKLLPQLRKKKK